MADLFSHRAPIYVGLSVTFLSQCGFTFFQRFVKFRGRAVVNGMQPNIGSKETNSDADEGKEEDQGPHLPT